MDPDRYAGKPMLRLLELYVLWSIEQISDEDDAKLHHMAPKLHNTFGGDGTWQDAISTAMELPQNMPQLIRENWERNQGIAAANAAELGSQQFAEMFVDANLVG